MCQSINNFIAEETNYEINDAITQSIFLYRGIAKIHTITRFSDEWKDPFDSVTREETFTVSGGRTIKMQMMHTSSQVQVKKIHEEYGTFTRIPYEGGCSMIIYMRHEAAAFPQIYDDISWMSKDSRFEKIKSDLENVEEGSYILAMPKFKYEMITNITNGIYNIDPFCQFSMSDMFNETVMTPFQYLDNISHETSSRIDNNEQGTSPESVLTCSKFRGYIHKIDKPFCFFILQTSGHIIDLGIFTGTYC